MDVLRTPAMAQLRARRGEKWDGYDEDVVVSTIAEMDFCVHPRIAHVLHDAVNRHDLGYAHERIGRLAEAFAGFAHRRLGWTVDPGQVSLVPDVMMGVLELARALAGPRGAIAVATPAYPPFLVELPAAGLTVRQLPLRPDGSYDVEALCDEVARGTRVVIVVNPHNPTGRVPPRAELAQIAEVCAERGAVVIADEIHAPLTLPPAVHTPWLEVSDAARACGFALSSASKAFNVAGLKAALLVTASPRTRSLAGRLVPMAEHAGLLGVLAAETAFAEGDDWLDALLVQLDANRSLLAGLLSASLPDVSWKPPEASYLAWLDCRRLGLGRDPAAAFLRRGRVALSPGVEYGAVGAGHVRLNFGTSTELVRLIVERMARSTTITRTA